MVLQAAAVGMQMATVQLMLMKIETVTVITTPQIV